MNKLAGVLGFQVQVRGGGRDASTSIRAERGSTVRWVRSGRKHPSTLTSMSNLALILHIKEKDLATRESQAGRPLRSAVKDDMCCEDATLLATVLIVSQAVLSSGVVSHHQCLQLSSGNETRPLYCPRHLTNSESLLVAFPIRQSRLFFVLFCSARLPFPRSFYSDRYDLITLPHLQALASFNDPLRKSISLRCNRSFS